MKLENLEGMMKGWFVGNFSPTLYKTEDVEVAVKSYKAGDKEDWHYHKIATEITVIVNGHVRMNDIELDSGDIIVLEPGEGSDFEALVDTTTTVVKIPGVPNDKYLREQND